MGLELTIGFAIVKGILLLALYHYHSKEFTKKLDQGIQDLKRIPVGEILRLEAFVSDTGLIIKATNLFNIEAEIVQMDILSTEFRYKTQQPILPITIPPNCTSTMTLEPLWEEAPPSVEDWILLCRVRNKHQMMRYRIVPFTNIG